MTSRNAGVSRGGTGQGSCGLILRLSFCNEEQAYHAQNRQGHTSKQTRSHAERFGEEANHRRAQAQQDFREARHDETKIKSAERRLKQDKDQAQQYMEQAEAEMTTQDGKHAEAEVKT